MSLHQQLLDDIKDQHAEQIQAICAAGPANELLLNEEFPGNPLCYAVEQANYAAIKILADYITEPAVICDGLCEAVETLNLEMIKFYIETFQITFDHPDQTLCLDALFVRVFPLYKQLDSYEIFDYLLSVGIASKHPDGPLVEGVICGDSQIFERILASAQQYQPIYQQKEFLALRWAIEKKQIDRVQKLLDYGYQPTPELIELASDVAIKQLLEAKAQELDWSIGGTKSASKTN